MADIKRPDKENYKPSEINCAEDMCNWNMKYAQELDNFIDHLEKENEWISVGKRLPELENLVNILFYNNEVSSGKYYKKGGWYDCSIEEYVNQSELKDNVIGWKPLPKPPVND